MARPKATLRRVVAKIGSASLTAEKGRFDSFAASVAQVVRSGSEVALVSSGAIALGREALKLSKRPTEIPMLQTCAAVGQSLLMQAWQTAFHAHGLVVAQVLLTHADFRERDRYLHVQRAIQAMFEAGVVPVINENDTVSVDEIKFGDNDQLAAMVATLCSADLLVLLTDVEGLLDASGKRVAAVSNVEEARALIQNKTSELGTGGMGSKLEAAHRASLRGVPAVIADARDPEILVKVVAGENVGTWVGATDGGKRSLSSRKHWIAYTLRPLGAIWVDAGAAKAVSKSGGSLLSAGVLGVRGDFDAGDCVSVMGVDGVELARGLVRFSVRDLARIAGVGGAELSTRLGYEVGPEVIHRDDMVVL